jgi:hypothetical protein
MQHSGITDSHKVGWSLSVLSKAMAPVSFRGVTGAIVTSSGPDREHPHQEKPQVTGHLHVSFVERSSNLAICDQRKSRSVGVRALLLKTIHQPG